MKNNELYDEYLGYQSMTSSSMEVHLFCTTAIQNAGVELHYFFEIYCALEGHLTFTVDGKKIELEKEDIVLLPPMTEHQEMISEREADRVILWLNPWYLNRISSRKTNLNQCFVSAEKKGYLLREDPAMRKKIINMLLELRYEMHEKEFGHDIMCDSLVEHLLILLESHLNLNTMAGYANIQQVIRYINLHYTENLTLDFLCNRFYISKFYLSRSFENATGKSIYQYVLEKRMIMARQLLISGEKPTDIFSLCGFGQYSNFYRAFKKYYHMSPMTFLKKMNYEEKNE